MLVQLWYARLRAVMRVVFSRVHANAESRREGRQARFTCPARPRCEAVHLCQMVLEVSRGARQCQRRRCAAVPPAASFVAIDSAQVYRALCVVARLFRYRVRVPAPPASLANAHCPVFFASPSFPSVHQGSYVRAAWKARRGECFEASCRRGPARPRLSCSRDISVRRGLLRGLRGW